MENSLEQNIDWLLVRAAIPAKHTFMKLAEEYELTYMQLFTLCLIGKDKEVTMQSVSASLGCDASNTTGIVERLVAGHFINRHEGASDRRIKVLSLTDKGKVTHQRLTEAFRQNPSPIFASLSPEEVANLKALLIKAVATCSVSRKAKIV